MVFNGDRPSLHIHGYIQVNKGLHKMNRDKIGTQTCYDTSTYLCWYIDVYSMSVSQSCLCSAIPIMHLLLSFLILQAIVLTITCSPE